MVGSLKRVWAWFVDGTNDLVGGVLERWSRRPAIRCEVAEDGGSLQAPDGTVLASRRDGDGPLMLASPQAAERLRRAAVVLAVPPGWLFTRQLDPVQAQGAPFLTAFVQHQIERVTPFRADDVLFCVRQAPLPGDASRLAVEIGVVPKRLAAGVLEVVRSCQPARLTLVAHAARGGAPFAIPVADATVAHAATRRPFVALALIAFLLAWPLALGWIGWSTALVQGEMDDADRVIDERKAMLAAAARHDHADSTGDAALLHLKEVRPAAVDLLEALSAALPDSAYVTDLSIDKEHLRVSGVSTNTAALVPALEKSGQFTDAAFFDAITKVEGGAGDRFHIEMSPVVPHAGAAPP